MYIKLAESVSSILSNLALSAADIKPACCVVAVAIVIVCWSPLASVNWIDPLSPSSTDTNDFLSFSAKVPSIP